MSDDHRKLYGKKVTGTVPKIKHRNNTSNINAADSYSNVFSNNLGGEANRPDYTRQYVDTPRNSRFTGFNAMEPMNEPRQNGIPIIEPRQNGTPLSNGTSTPNTSRTNSRRNSTGTVPKCENVSKYPDKRQIESKLNQIREYLSVTSSLMMSMKNTDEQEDETEKENLEMMLKELIDSEAKLVVMLGEADGGYTEDVDNIQCLENGGEPTLDVSSLNKNELEEKVEVATREMQMLREQENLLLHLQINAESQLREARHAQERLMKGHGRPRNLEPDGLHNGYTDAPDSASNSGASGKNYNGTQANAVRELEERLRGLNPDTAPKNSVEQYQNQIDSMQNRISQIREGNDNRNQLIQMLDNRDAQLQVEHGVLQGKLLELQNKKMQVDQLVLQLQNMNEESEDEEMGNQVKRIVNMKEQLAKLKDMLSIVQNTDGTIEMQNINESDVEEHVRRVCSKTDNLVQKDGRSIRRQMDNNSSHSSNERMKEKQVNKKTMNANERERIKLQAELQAKKRELEELMCKHKAATSNLNQDVSSENKSDVGSCGHPLFDGAMNSWFPVPANMFNAVSQTSDRYSSDECPEDDMNEYSEVNSTGDTNSQLVQPMPSLSYPTSNYVNRRANGDEPRPDVPPEPMFLATARRSPERRTRSESVVTSRLQPERSCSNLSPGKNQVQKQLELIKSVCDSMLEDTVANENNVHVRNNLTPSPVYTEPRQYASPNGHSLNALNIINPMAENPFPSVPPFSMTDAGNYQNWLTTNTLQTQAFMLNTLNQCCQMLWLQQRELSTLRSTVTLMQERFQGGGFEAGPNSIPAYMNSNPCVFPSVPTVPVHNSQPNNHYRPGNQLKVNQPPVVGATSMPNLNHPHCPQANPDNACANHCNLQNARILDSALNNSVLNHQNAIGEHMNNSVLHSVNQALPSQIWSGQALNNQVAPGNRANNYWDNFRSYSRQNLLSTKSNEGLQNLTSTLERSNNSLDRPQPLFVSQLQSVPKLNTEHQEVTSSASAENTPRRAHVRAARQRSNSGTVGPMPPDVLNVNQIQPMPKSNETSYPLDFGTGDPIAACHPFLNSYGNNESFSELHDNKERPGSVRNRNEWHDDAPSENNSTKSKLFEELRENVYKEVASLISANQGRPHFLIQLFRDLQLVSSDPLRRRTLQSIQSVITNSLSTGPNPSGAMRQLANQHRMDNEEILEESVPLSADYFDMHPFVWPHLPKLQKNESDVDTSSQEHLSEVLTFLNSHNDDIFSDSLVHSLRDILVDSTFSAIFTTSNSKDGIIQKHFASLLTEALEQYRGKKVQDVRMNVLQTVEDLLRGEISLIRLMRENISESEMNSLESNLPMPQFEMSVPLVIEETNDPLMQNGDLAEADQSRLDVDEDDEGAVGGVLNILLERSSSSNVGQVLNDENDVPQLDLVLNSEADIEFVEQGLDQVPTRLTTYNSSRSNTPSKDKMNQRLDGP